MYTPWKFGLSLGHTFGTTLALGASYEFADYAHVDQRYKTDDRDYYYYSYESSESDKEMNRHTKNTLKGVSTLKVGAELKPYPSSLLPPTTPTGSRPTASPAAWATCWAR